jgi:type I restriction enzyme M protein
MQEVAENHLIPFLRLLGSDGAPLRKHMASARYEIPTGRLLAKVVDLLSDLPMKQREHLTKNGVIDPGLLYESPFTDRSPDGPNGVFDEDQVDQLLTCIRALNQAAVASKQEDVASG